MPAILSGGLALCFGPHGGGPLACPSTYLTLQKSSQATLLPVLSTYVKILLIRSIMGVFSAHLVVPGVPAAQRVLAVLEGPAPVHLEGPASLGDLGDQGHLQRDRWNIDQAFPDAV